MYEIIKNVILSGRYELTDLLAKVDTIWIQGGITETERAELATLARDQANPENSYAPLQKQIDTLYSNFEELAAQVKANTDAITELEGGTVVPPEVEEYPEYQTPSGSHDAYHKGDKVTYRGKRYICQVDGCVWPPSDYPQGWLEVDA